MKNKFLLWFIVVILIIYRYYIINLYEKFTNPDIKITPDTDNIKNKIIFILWTGGTLTQNRIKGIKQIRDKTKCNVTLINYKDNLKKFILKDYPLHKGYKYLSAIHKADYLRCYMMHHYGGGYSDIKAAKHSWIPAFETIEKDKNIWAFGCSNKECKFKFKTHRGPYPEEEYNNRLNNRLTKNHNKMIGVGYFIYRPRTKITYEWYNNLNKRMDFYYNKLKQNPAKFPRESADGTPRPKWEGGNHGTKYPLSWNRILGQINYPIQLKYLNNIKHGIKKADDYNYLYLLIRMISISKAITRLRFSKLNHQHVDIFFYDQT